MNTYETMAAMLVVGLSAALGTTLAACDTEEPTKVVVENAYPVVPDGGDPATQRVVYKVWWVTTLFKEPVLPGASSDEERSVPETDFVYALLAPGWDPKSQTPPTSLLAMKSKAKVGVARGETLRIRISEDTFAGSCSAKLPLSQDDSDFITQRIFPGDFAGVAYDAKTCVGTAVPVDGGSPPDGGFVDAATP